MIEMTRTYTDPFGDPHIIVERFYPYFPSALEDHSRSYADKYYPFGIHLSYSMQTHINEEQEAAANAWKAIAFEIGEGEDCTDDLFRR